MKFLELASHIISIVLHPLFMAVYGVSLLFVLTDMHVSMGTYFWFILPVFILSCLMPANGIFLMRRFNLITDYSLSNKKERFGPFIITFVSYAILLLFYYYRTNVSFWFIGTLTVPLALLIVASVINIWWKISTHMISIGGLIGCILSIAYMVKGANPYWLFIVLFLLAGCLGTARLILKRHTPAQVYLGFCLGLIVSYFCIYYSIKITIFKLIF